MKIISNPGGAISSFVPSTPSDLSLDVPPAPDRLVPMGINGVWLIKFSP